MIIMNFSEFYLAFHDPFWVVVLSSALFYPVRQLIWILYVRKKQKEEGDVSEELKQKQKRRANFTSILLCVVFSYIYVIQVFK